MINKNTLELLEYGIKHDKKFTLLDYYAFVDSNIRPKELAKELEKNGNKTMAICLREFDYMNLGLHVTLKIEDKVNAFHSIDDKVVSAEDKMYIKNLIEQEGYPLTDGVYHAAMLRYYKNEESFIHRENAKARVINSYCKYKEEEERIQQEKAFISDTVQFLIKSVYN